MKFKDVPVGSLLRFIRGSEHIYHKFDPSFVSYYRRGEVKRAHIKPDTEVQEIVEGG